MLAVEVQKLTKFFKKQPALLEVNLEVEQGDFVGLIGTAGSGKTTLIRTLLNYSRATAGTAKVFGLDTKKQATQIKDMVGYVPNEVNYFSGSTVKTILQNAASFYSDISNDYIENLCDVFDLDATRKISTMSHGNRKKLAIVVALMKKPKMLILDEPTVGLTPEIKNKLFKLLSDINQKGITIIYSTQNLAEVQRLCNKVVVFHSGSLLSVSSTSDIFDQTARVIRIKSDDDIKPILSYFKINEANFNQDTTIFLYNGNINVLLESLTSFNIKDLQISLPSLEDTVYRLYETKAGEGAELIYE